MNKADKMVIGAILEALETIPAAGVGSNSATILGFVTYHADMERFRTFAMRALRPIVWPHGYDAEDTSPAIEELKAFIAKRQIESWASPRQIETQRQNPQRG